MVCHISVQNPGVKFLDYKPHEKGIINAIEFLRWSNGSQFVTGGCDHGVVLWTEKEEGWQPRLLHRTLHSSSVTGVGGIANKNNIISSGLFTFFTFYHTIWILDLHFSPVKNKAVLMSFFLINFYMNFQFYQH